ncbi:MAG: hypothetical protein LBU51_04935 [Bacteroidales bacterium]|jgi:hypothetical protein|nr:hypothetical protein [Bacteroidales bacterium]
MAIDVDEWEIEEETYLKGRILAGGVIFSPKSLEVAIAQKAKGQNRVYNMPVNAEVSRPQELCITGNNHYEVVVSCVAPNGNNDPIYLDANIKGELIAIDNNKIIENVNCTFVQEPHYYSSKISNGDLVKKYVTSCGFDEFNIIPWKGCAISKGCKFCGTNSFIDADSLNAVSLSKNFFSWQNIEKTYLNNLREAAMLAINDGCYKEHVHIILIAGNLSDTLLDAESEVFMQIANTIKDVIAKKTPEGIILVVTPPIDTNILYRMKESGISTVVFNLEAATRNAFKKYCPGKDHLGYDFFVERLEKAVEIFGQGHAWTNFVLGLEPIQDLLTACTQLSRKGIICSANVLHLDKGNTLDCSVPAFLDIINFFYQLEEINKQYNYKPYYCAKALRTSLSNEAYAGRITKRSESNEAKK